MKITDVKYCSCCKQHKMRDEFYRNVRTKDGLQSYCKPCARAAEKRSRLKLANYRAALWGRA